MFAGRPGRAGSGGHGVMSTAAGSQLPATPRAAADARGLLRSSWALLCCQLPSAGPAPVACAGDCGQVAGAGCALLSLAGSPAQRPRLWKGGHCVERL